MKQIVKDEYTPESVIKVSKFLENVHPESYNSIVVLEDNVGAALWAEQEQSGCFRRIKNNELVEHTVRYWSMFPHRFYALKDAVEWIVRTSQTAKIFVFRDLNEFLKVAREKQWICYQM